jgi:hypothetical protein
MIVESKVREIETSDNVKTKGFSIKASGKAFKLLSSGLYKDKIKAIIREISCNAYDSHKAAGNPNPFDVHLPNQFDPTFTVRDYGTGLSDEDMLNLFTTYFESTKTNTNDQIGAFGLGSKSPFSYTTQFTATSFFPINETTRMKSVYQVFLNSYDEPSISLLHQEETDEPSGLEISLSIEPRDFNTFQRSAVEVYRYFDLKPNVTPTLTYPESQVFLEGEKYRVLKYGNAVAIMGVVAYPIDTSIISHKAARWAVELKFDIGDVDITAGREELSYDPQTIAAVNKALDGVVNDYYAQASTEIKKCKTMKEAYEFYGKYSEYMSDPLLFRGHKISTDVVKYWNDTTDNVSVQRVENTGPIKDFNKSFDIATTDAIILDDGTPCRTTKLRYWKNSRRGRAWVFSRIPEVLKKSLEGWEIINLADLPKPPPRPRANYSYVRQKPIMSVLNVATGAREEETVRPLVEGEVYIRHGTANYLYGDHMISMNDSGVNFLALCKLLGLDKLYFVTTTTNKKHLVNAVDLKTYVSNRMNHPEVLSILRYNEIEDSSTISVLRSLVTIMEEKNPDHVVLPVIKRKVEVYSMVNYDLRRKFKLYPPHTYNRQKSEFELQWDELVMQYPLLTSALNGREKHTYITLVDELNSLREAQQKVSA